MGRIDQAIRYETHYQGMCGLHEIAQSFNIFKYLDPLYYYYSKNFISSATSKTKEIWKKERQNLRSLPTS